MSPEIEQLILAIGYLGVFIVVLFESGLFGFFLPGSSLLFTAGFLSSQGILTIEIILVMTLFATVAGNSLGYLLGARYGKYLFASQKIPFFKKKHLLTAEQFYKKHGGKTIILARFIPVLRAFAPFVAGLSRMDKKQFYFYNILGGILWAIGVPLLGYLLGETIPEAPTYILPSIAIIVLLLFLPKGARFVKNQLSFLTKKQ